MLGESASETRLHDLAKVRASIPMDEKLHELPGRLLLGLNVHFSQHHDAEIVRTRQLRIVWIFRRPALQGFGSKIEFADQIRIGRVIAGADGAIFVGVVDAEIAHLHAAEILVTGRRAVELFALQMSPLALGRVTHVLLGALRCGRLRRRRDGRRRWSPRDKN